jgi:hypothetical protein
VVKANSTRKLTPRSERIAAFVISLWIAFFFGSFSHQLYWTRQQSHALYQFTAQAKAPLVPIHCKGKRGVQGVDFIVASARAYNPKPMHVEACWYPVDRFQALFPEEETKSEVTIIRDHYRQMKFRVREFNSKPPSLLPLVGIPIAIMIAIIGFLAMVLGPKTVIEEENIEEEPKVDPVKLAADLLQLRKNLEQR